MSLNLGSLSPITTAATTLSNLILVSPQKTIGYQPQNSPSWQKNTQSLPPSYLFNYEGEQSTDLVSDITDHYVENNSAIQDQIALKPVVIKTHGFVGELNDIPPAALAVLQQAAQKLSALSSYTPQLSAAAVIAYDEAFQLYQVGINAVNSAVSTWASINGQGGESVINGSGITSQPNQNQQQICFQNFYGYWNNRKLFTIQTPWAVFQDMAIMNLHAIQDESTRMISTFEVTFKQIRFATTQVTTPGILFDNNNMQSPASQQGADLINNGTNILTPASTSFASTLA